METKVLFEFNELASKINYDPKKDKHNFFKTLENMKEDMNFIKTNRFAWDFKKADKMKLFFNPLANKLKSPLFIKFGNFDFFRKNFPLI